MSHNLLPDDAPIVNASWIARKLGITPGCVRRYIDPDGPLPRLGNHILGMHEYTWLRDDAVRWISAYKAAPKRGRRGDGTARIGRWREKAIRALDDEISELKCQHSFAEQASDGKECDRLAKLLHEADRSLTNLINKRSKKYRRNS